jgi:hypothetical protein
MSYKTVFMVIVSMTVILLEIIFQSSNFNALIYLQLISIFALILLSMEHKKWAWGYIIFAGFFVDLLKMQQVGAQSLIFFLATGLVILLFNLFSFLDESKGFLKIFLSLIMILIINQIYFYIIGIEVFILAPSIIISNAVAITLGYVIFDKLTENKNVFKK